MVSYKLDPEFEFWISGRWAHGGLAEIYHDGYSAGGIKLPRVRWGVFAALAQQAIRAASPVRAFMTASEILSVLRRHKVLQTRDPERVVRLIHELRNGLNKSRAGKFQTAWDGEQRNWGKRVIEKNQLGYRLSLPPDRIHLDFLGPDPSEPPEPGSSSAVATTTQLRDSTLSRRSGPGQVPSGIGALR